jgi:hypothetical protein
MTRKVLLHLTSVKNFASVSPEAEVIIRGTEGEIFTFDSDKTNYH